MVLKKSPNDLELEDLLKALEQEGKVESTADNHPNDVLSFVQAFKITKGEHKVRSNVLYKLYNLWSKNPLNRNRFSEEFDSYFIPEAKPPWKYYTINLNPVMLSDSTFEILKRKIIDKTKSKVYKKHFDSFVSHYSIKSGTSWIKSEVLYHLYDKWTYKNRNNNPLGYNQFLSFCQVYLPRRRITQSRMMWFGIDKDSLFQHLSLEQQREVRNTNVKEDKKTQVKKGKGRISSS